LFPDENDFKKEVGSLKYPHESKVTRFSVNTGNAAMRVIIDYSGIICFLLWGKCILSISNYCFIYYVDADILQGIIGDKVRTESSYVLIYQ